jgi:hypothetical protein
MLTCVHAKKERPLAAGRCYLEGRDGDSKRNGITKDEKKAVGYIIKAAGQGHAVRVRVSMLTLHVHETHVT